SPRSEIEMTAMIAHTARITSCSLFSELDTSNPQFDIFGILGLVQRRSTRSVSLEETSIGTQIEQ
ncbi:MAG: hypothetical protein OXD38_03770, partial [Aestuariivita sp.]|nr:hypothetical protein [Aestuariivita sp.]